MTVQSKLVSSRSATLIPLLLLLAYRKKLLSMFSSKRSSTLTAQTPGFLTTPQLEKAQRDMFKIGEDGVTREILVPAGGKLKKVVIRPTKQEVFLAHRKAFAPPEKKGKGKEAKDEKAVDGSDEKDVKDGSMKKVGVNKEFFRQLRAIFLILIPRTTSKEVGLIAVHSFFLLLRTYLSLLVARLDGAIVRDLVSADAKGFLRGLMYWYILAVPSTYTNSMLRYLQSKLAISFRTRLTRYVHDLYLSKEANFYKIINLDSSIDSADQYIATDILRFSDSLASLYSNTAKPLLDLVLFNIQLGRSIGKFGSAGLMINYLLTAWILRKVTPSFGKLAAVEAKLEGDFRSAHSRLITNAEEIAFYNGAKLEKDILNRSYLRLIRHINSIFKIRIAYNFFEDWLLKYSWSAVGYGLVSIPVFFGDAVKAVQQVAGVEGVKPSKPAMDHNSVGKRTEAYMTNRRLMLSLADAGGRLMYSGKDLAELAGFTSRVFSLLSTLHSLDDNVFQSVPRPESHPAGEKWHDLGHVEGQVAEGEADIVGVEFKGVPVVAPAPGLERGGEVLVRGLDVVIGPGQHCLITGPNGVGKTSVARVLSGLWPCFEGVVKKPFAEQIMYLPQRPYLSLGSLRDQIIYPHSYPQFAAAGGTDDDLMQVLKYAHLAYIPAREGGWDTVKEWKDVFSGGEKQRVGIARLFYHMPKFGVLDECTSAVSTDVEGLLYSHAKDLGITLITISHRPSLLKYHDKLLRLAGEEGKWELTQIGTEEESMSLEKEVHDLEARLGDVEGMKTRLGEIGDELAFQRV